MKQKVCATVMLICIFLIIGLAGGVECGEPLSNLLWCLPLSLVALGSALVGDFF